MASPLNPNQFNADDLDPSQFGKSGGRVELTAEQRGRKAELGEQLQSIMPKWAEMMRARGADRPDWEPLNKVVGEQAAKNFSFSGYTAGGEGGIRTYKHLASRRSLHIDEQGNLYHERHNPRTDTSHMDPTSREFAYKRVYDEVSAGLFGNHSHFHYPADYQHPDDSRKEWLRQKALEEDPTTHPAPSVEHPNRQKNRRIDLT